MAFRYFKFAIFVGIAICFYLIGIKFGHIIGEDVVKYLILPLTFIMLNYAFIKLILYLIAYYNSLIIFHDFKVIVIKSTLFKISHMEIIDLDKITKFDTYVNSIMANLIGFGTLVLEQQRDKVRELRYVPDSHRAVRILSRAKKKLIEQQGFDTL